MIPRLCTGSFPSAIFFLPMHLKLLLWIWDFPPAYVHYQDMLKYYEKAVKKSSKNSCPRHIGPKDSQRPIPILLGWSTPRKNYFFYLRVSAVSSNAIFPRQWRPSQRFSPVRSSCIFYNVVQHIHWSGECWLNSQGEHVHLHRNLIFVLLQVTKDQNKDRAVGPQRPMSVFHTHCSFNTLYFRLVLEASVQKAVNRLLWDRGNILRDYRRFLNPEERRDTVGWHPRILPWR